MEVSRSSFYRAVESAAASMSTATTAIRNAGRDATARETAFNDYAETLAELRRHAAGELSPLDICFVFIEQNLGAFRAHADAAWIEENGAELLNSWCRLLLAIVGDGNDESISALLIELQRPEWPHEIDEDAAYRLVESLMSMSFPDDTPVPQALPHATSEAPRALDPGKAENLVVDFDPELNPELRDAFINEVPGRMSRLSDLVLALAAAEDFEQYSSLLVEAQRQAHTIKGSSNITGVYGLANLTHLIEDCFEFCLDYRTMLDVAHYDRLVDATDAASGCVDYLRGLAAQPAAIAPILDSLITLRAELHAGGSTAPAVSGSAPGQNHPNAQAREISAPVDAPAENSRRSIADLDTVINNASELSISTVQLEGFRDEIQRGLQGLLDHQDSYRQRFAVLEELAALRGIKFSRDNVVSAAQAGMDSGVEDFDSLELDQYNELHSVISVLGESLTDLREMTRNALRQLRRLDELLIHQDRMSRELTDTLLASKMVQPRTIASRLQRIVRQTCRATGKRVTLDVIGGDVDLDADTLAAVTDPLMHLLRNAIDHGIEAPRERAVAGKSEQGIVTVEFARQGDDIVVSCGDDGRGFDFETIHRRACAMGVINPEQRLSEDELARIALLPGFTTRQSVDQISGRGIGLDVVVEQVRARRGGVSVASTPGQGSRVSMRLSMQMVQMQLLLVSERGQTIALPATVVNELVFAESGAVAIDDRGAPVVHRQGRALDLVSLGQLLGHSTASAVRTADKPLPILIVDVDQSAYAVALEQPLDNERLVVKQLGDFMPHLPGFIGGAVLGDGTVAPVVDIRELIRLGAGGQAYGEMIAARIGNDTRAARNKVLVVDDSLSARRSMAQVVADAGFDVTTAVDGLDAAEMLSQWGPDLVLTDLEMPRMNGIELTRHLRNHAQYIDVPVIMLTSRTTQKHRDLARDAGVNVYLTKPFSEDDVVDHLARLI